MHRPLHLVRWDFPLQPGEITLRLPMKLGITARTFPCPCGSISISLLAPKLYRTRAVATLISYQQAQPTAMLDETTHRGN